MRTQTNVSAREFAEAWELSASTAEVCQRTKMSKQQVLSRVSKYRKMGVHLKDMPKDPRNKIDVEGLNQSILELRKSRLGEMGHKPAQSPSGSERMKEILNSTK